MNVEFHPGVSQDIAQAADFYQSVSEGLAMEFQAELRKTIALARKYPRRFHLIKNGCRRANVQRFPYHVIYREFPDRIRVILIRHHQRDPRFGMGRR